MFDIRQFRFLIFFIIFCKLAPTSGHCRTPYQNAGLRANRITKALYSFAKDGKVKVMVGTHVDDILWAADPEYEYMVKKILATFDIRKMRKILFDFVVARESRMKKVISRSRARVQWRTCYP